MDRRIGEMLRRTPWIVFAIRDRRVAGRTRGTPDRSAWRIEDMRAEAVLAELDELDLEMDSKSGLRA